MSPRLVQCVPIFPEGRDAARIKVVTDAIAGVAGVKLLDVAPRADTNRTAVTFVGDPDSVVEAAFRAARAIAQLLDAPSLSGARSGLGVLVACPFVPVEGVTLGDCMELAGRLRKQVREELGVPAARTLMSMATVEFVDAVSRDTPTPAGGSVAALAGALGAALASMVASLTRGRAPGQEDDDAVPKAAEMATRAKDALVRLVDEDTNAFNAYLEARRLPKDTPEARTIREAAVQQSLAVTVDVPWRVAVACVEVMQAASIALRHGNPAAITDAMQGVAMGFAGVRGGIWSVTANLGAVKDPAFRREMKERCARLLAEAERLMDEAVRSGDQALERMLGTKP